MIDVDRFLEVMMAHATVLGAMIGVRFGEGFFSTGPVGVSTLPIFGDRGPRPSGYQLFN